MPFTNSTLYVSVAYYSCMWRYVLSASLSMKVLLSADESKS